MIARTENLVELWSNKEKCKPLMGDWWGGEKIERSTGGAVSYRQPAEALDAFPS